MKKNAKERNLAGMLVFAGVNIVALVLLRERVYVLIGSLDFLILIVLGLGVYRTADILVFEKVAEPVREIVSGENLPEKKKGKLILFLRDLFSCPSCLGVWIAMLTVYSACLFPGEVFAFHLIMALSAIERLVSKVYNVLEKKES